MVGRWDGRRDRRCEFPLCRFFLFFFATEWAVVVIEAFSTEAVAALCTGRSTRRAGIVVASGTGSDAV